MEDVGVRGIWLPEEVFLRRYRDGDLAEICRLDEACFEVEFRFSRGSMRRFVEQKGAIVVVAERSFAGEMLRVIGSKTASSGGGEAAAGIVGFVVVQLGKGGWGYVVTLDVAEEWRRRGLGGALMEEAEGLARAAGAEGMELHVYSENEGAIRFYEGRGYGRVGVVKGFYGAGMDGLVYRNGLVG